MRSMKKLLAVCLALALFLSFSACRGGADPWQSVELVLQGEDEGEAGKAPAREREAKTEKDKVGHGSGVAGHKSERPSKKPGAKSSPKRKDTSSSGSAKPSASSGSAQPSEPSAVSGPGLAGKWMWSEAFEPEDLNDADSFLLKMGFAEPLKVRFFWELTEDGRCVQTSEILNAEEYRQELCRTYLEYERNAETRFGEPPADDDDPETAAAAAAEAAHVMVQLTEDFAHITEYVCSVEGDILRNFDRKGNSRGEYRFSVEGDRLTLVNMETDVRLSMTRVCAVDGR